jgi:hypothetical protein
MKTYDAMATRVNEFFHVVNQKITVVGVKFIFVCEFSSVFVPFSFAKFTKDLITFHPTE